MDFWLAMPLLMAVLAFVTGALDILSALTGGVMGYMILFAGGPGWLVLLIVFFALSTAATGFGQRVKEKKGVFEKKRSIENVVANGIVPLAFVLQGNLYGFAASLAAATSDTLSSEIGVLSKSMPVSILDLKTKLEAGTDGGVSPLGTTAAFVGSGAIAAACLLLFGDWPLFWTVLWCGVFGCLVDSVLGATLQQDGVLGNHLVNLSAALSAGLLASALAGMI